MTASAGRRADEDFVRSFGPSRIGTVERASRTEMRMSPTARQMLSRGALVVIYSRGRYRLATVLHVARTGTVTAGYTTITSPRKVTIKSTGYVWNA